jgi:hypothetical protein
MQQKDRFNKKSFPFKETFQSCSSKAGCQSTTSVHTCIRGRQLAPLEYPLEYPDYATEVVEGGKYTYSFVLIPLAILGTAIVSMMPR